jgi:diguanylate cyclase (GGDEF)-like protein
VSAEVPARAPEPAPEPAPAPASAGDERFRALFEHAPVGVALSEPGGRFTDVNHTLRDLLDGTGIDPDVDGPADLARHLPEGAEEAVAWHAGLADVCAGRAPVARAELALTPPDAGPLWVQATAASVVLGDHRYLLTHVEDTTGRHLAEQRLLRLALHDALTGLANRTLLADRLAAALARDVRTGLRTGVLYVDLDGFKRVNDRLGHEAGDHVLVAIGRRLAGTLRAGDTAGRVGGDEFLVVAGDVPDRAALDELARRVTAALALPLQIPGRPAVVSASVGAVLAGPGDTLTTVMRRADAAMFGVKRARRATARLDVDAVQLTLLPDLAEP